MFAACRAVSSSVSGADSAASSSCGVREHHYYTFINLWSSHSLLKCLKINKQATKPLFAEKSVICDELGVPKTEDVPVTGTGARVLFDASLTKSLEDKGASLRGLEWLTDDTSSVSHFIRD